MCQKNREESMSENTSHKGQVSPSKKRGKEGHKEKRVNLKAELRESLELELQVQVGLEGG